MGHITLQRRISVAETEIKYLKYHIPRCIIKCNYLVRDCKFIKNGVYVLWLRLL